jgi:hypothetical protein
MNVKNIVLGIAIFLLTLFVGMYGIRALYSHEPQYDDYCKPINTPNECFAINGTWQNMTDKVVPSPMNGGKVVPIENGYCNYDYNICTNDYNKAEENYRIRIFYTAIPLGVIVIAIGLIFFGLESVGAGLMAGGVGILIYGVSGYWRYSSDFIRFLISLLGLIVVIYLAYYANKKWGNNKRRKR